MNMVEKQSFYGHPSTDIVLNEAKRKCTKCGAIGQFERVSFEVAQCACGWFYKYDRRGRIIPFTKNEETAEEV
jgi:hypothetical protein